MIYYNTVLTTKVTLPYKAGKNENWHSWFPQQHLTTKLSRASLKGNGQVEIT